MGFSRRTLTLQLLGLIAAVVAAVGLQAREGKAGAEQIYPYQVVATPQEGCSYDYVQVGADARVLPLEPAAPDTADDDGAALLRLEQPFELYQAPGNSLVVSGNGYLAATESLSNDDGTDFSNDCPLPVTPDNPRHSSSRIYVYHDDLRPQRGGGLVREAFFADCPRKGAAGADEPCTVVEWDGFERNGPLASSSPLRMQAVLYHRSHEIALQYASLDDSHGGSATIGLQGFDGAAARGASCNQERRALPRSAVCFLDPRGRGSSYAAAP